MDSRPSNGSARTVVPAKQDAATLNEGDSTLHELVKKRTNYFVAVAAACFAARDLMRAALLRWRTLFATALSVTDATLRRVVAFASGSLISSNCFSIVRSFVLTVRLRRLRVRLWRCRFLTERCFATLYPFWSTKIIGPRPAGAYSSAG